MRFLLLFFLIPMAYAEIDLGAFLDTYYAYDFNSPKNNRRPYTTQPSRHNEPSVNLAYIDATLQEEKFRGRLAFQHGTSVTRNYTEGANEGMQSIQEAYLGMKLGSSTWIDGGVFFGHIGMESWISKNNLTYTRSLILDYVPYYSSGVRLEHKLNETESFQVQVIQGWQNIHETNSAKSVGLQYKRGDFTYNGFFGDEEVVSEYSRFRSYHNFIYGYDLTDWQILGSLDIGQQVGDLWYGTSVIARQKLNALQALAYRLEYYLDRHQANVLTHTKNGFEVVSASMNFDQKIKNNILWRNELRGFHSHDAIFPRRKYLNGFFVTSIAVWF